MKLGKSLQQSNNILDIFADPQEQRARQSAQFHLKKMRQAAHCYPIIRNAWVFGTHTPCKNKHSKDELKPLLFISDKKIKHQSRS